MSEEQKNKLASGKLSRRDFLKGAAVVGGVAVSGGLLLTGCTPAATTPAQSNVEQTPPAQPQTPAPVVKEEIKWDYEADVVVIGSGGAGLPAALKAMEDGASVIIVEANWDVGGHAAVSGGNMHHGGGNSLQKKYEIEDSADQYYIDHTSGETIVSRFNDRECVRAVADNMVESYEFLISKGFKPRDVSPVLRYALDGPGLTPYDATGTEPDTVPRWSYTDATGWETYNGSPDGNTRAGIGVTRPLEKSLREAGCPFLLNYHMDRIYREYKDGSFTGKVLGIQASYTPTILPGETERLESLMSEGNIDSTAPIVNVKANKAVIVTTGGATGSLSFRTMIDPRLGPEFDGLSGMPFSDKDASGEYACMAIGASLGTVAQMMQQGGHQICMASDFGCQYAGGGYTPESKVWKLVRAKGIKPDYNSMIVVNMLGQRDGNEDVGKGGSYSYASYNYFNTALSSVIAPDENGVLTRYTGPHWAIFDQAAVDRNGYNMEQGGVDWDDGRCFKGDTLEELAQNVVNKYYEHVKMDPQILVDTVTKYNGFVAKKKDTDWGKTTLENKIETGPFYAAWATPFLHDSYGGIRINGKMQVIDINGDVIPGLYAAGECAGAMRCHGLGRVIVTGHIAGKCAATEAV